MLPNGGSGDQTNTGYTAANIATALAVYKSILGPGAAAITHTPQA